MYLNLRIKVPAIIESIVVYFLLRYRKNRYGYPFRKIKLTKGQYAIVDPEDYEKLIGYNWFAVEDLRTFYAQRNGNGKSIKMHRQIMNPPPGLFVDHQNHNGLDNRKANLKIATPAQNSRNRLKGRRKTSSKYKGVYFMKGINKWRADIYHNNKAIYLGYFENEEDAAKAYDNAAKIYHGDFASLNFP
ncbi:MAG: AP2 domain-containing protein [Phycisphaerae bacterium]|nr:AP2 domain-containing protein [Phycisphaerae bacterium]